MSVQKQQLNGHDDLNFRELLWINEATRRRWCDKTLAS